ncbi:acyl-CoA desaturase [Aliikangiella coralliicola]|uniref:acyl-CoA desaturase n=1 Tax=Aliikangiella coralliicola TaxID=2592383 RepID=UPI001AEFA32F|nr:acyl-CoA desaturase [Aliikangiella coralliicola]
MEKSDLKQKYVNERIVESNGCNAYDGKVVWSPVKSLWITSMYFIAIVGGILTFSISAFLIFLASTAVTLCLGHSLGMHRRLIHQSYQCPKWLEYCLVHFGVIVGLAGPKGMMHTHDMRDWAQRQNKCHDYFGHQQPFFIDAIWQLHCDLELKSPPKFIPEESFTNDRVYQWMEKTWMWQQLPWALLFFYWGGIAWVVWGICVRVAVSVTGHWLIGYFAHNEGDRDWHVEGASVQGYNIRFAALITMGESWHNNHHAFPGSALLGIEKNQVDPGWWVLRVLEKLGFVWNLKLPEDLPGRIELKNINFLETKSHSNEKSAIAKIPGLPDEI